MPNTNKLYIPADITGKEDGIEEKVAQYLDSVDVPNLQDCVDHVMGNLPAGVSRVDGYCIDPILKELIIEKNNAA